MNKSYKYDGDQEKSIFSSPRLSPSGYVVESWKILFRNSKLLLVFPLSAACLGVFGIIGSSFILAFAGVSETQQEITCGSLVSVLMFLIILGLLTWNFSALFLSSAVYELHKSEVLSIRHVLRSSFSRFRPIFIYSLIFTTVLIGIVWGTAHNSWDQIGEYCSSASAWANSDELPALDGLDVASGGHWAVVARIFNLFDPVRSSYSLLVGEMTLLLWSYLNFYVVPLIAMGVPAIKICWETGTSVRRSLRHVVFWLFSIEFFQFLILVPIIGSLGIFAAIFGICLFVGIISPMNSAYRTLVYVSLTNRDQLAPDLADKFATPENLEDNGDIYDPINSL